MDVPFVKIHLLVHLLKFKKIVLLVKERGFTLQGAKAKLKENKSDVVNTTELYDSLVRLKGFLVELKQSL